MPRFNTLSFAALACSIAAPALAQTAADRWGLTDRHWQTGTDMEIVRASRMAARCAEVKAIDE
ncbi:MAG: hypothetical protein ACKOPO_09235, partial [Novosphingobium sp.]